MPNETPAWLGTRKHKRTSETSVTANPIRWPTGKSPKAKEERRDAASAWFFVIAQTADSKAAMSTLLAMRQWLDMRTGVCTATNLQLAKWGGGISESQVSREISRFKKGGFMIVDDGWRLNHERKLRKSRTIHLAYPVPFPQGLTLPTDENHLAHGVQVDCGNEGDSAGIQLAPRAQETSTRAHDYEEEREF